MSGLQDPFQIIDAVDGKTGVLIKWHVTDEAKKFISSNNFDYLILDCTEPGGMDDLGFLVDNKEKIKDIRIHNDEINWDIINQLTSIRVLKIGGWFDCRGLDFRKLKELAYLKTDWNKGYDESLGDLKNLRGMELHGCGMKNFESFGKMPKLEYLSIYRARTPESLAGFENFKKLNHLQLEACCNINDIAALTVCKNLQYLEVVNCNKLRDASAIADIEKLSHLIIVGQFDTVSWLKTMRKLYTLRMDCKLEDGNIDFLYDMKNLKFINYNNKKNYTVKVKDIQKFLEDKGYDQEEAWSSHGLDFPEPNHFLD